MEELHDLIIYSLTKEQISKIQDAILPILGSYTCRLRDKIERDD